MKASSFWSSSGVQGPFFSPASFSQHGDRPIYPARPAARCDRRTERTGRRLGAAKPTEELALVVMTDERERTKRVAK